MIRRRIFLHRGMWSMERNALHMTIGFGFVGFLAIFLIFGANALWAAQAAAIGKLLAFAHVPYRLISLPSIDLSNGVPLIYAPGGRTFVVPIAYNALEPYPAIIAVLLLALASVGVYMVKRVPLPMRIVFLFLVTLGISTILYTSFVSPVPPKIINRISLDWQWSGALILLLLSAVFAFSVFPVAGPLWIKFSWLAGAIAYGIAWNTVRISLVLATLYHLGSTPFLLTHYLTGIYIDFIYIVAFYSLALAHLARHEVSEVGW